MYIYIYIAPMTSAGLGWLAEARLAETRLARVPRNYLQLLLLLLFVIIGIITIFVTTSYYSLALLLLLKLPANL